MMQTASYENELTNITLFYLIVDEANSLMIKHFY